MFFLCQEGSLVDYQAYKPYTLVGPPALQLVLDPWSCHIPRQPSIYAFSNLHCNSNFLFNMGGLYAGILQFIMNK